MIAYLSLGSNLGDRIEQLRNAYRALAAHPEIKNLKCSSFYETKPVGLTAQNDFINSAVRIETTLTPQALLAVCQTIENDNQRKRDIRWGPRTLDVDILVCESVTLDSETLTLPHPRMHERAFVLIPLAEIASNFTLSGQSIESWLKQIDTTGVICIEKPTP